MGLGTKRRQQQTADICKQHLREKYRDQRGLVEEFIVEIEGAPKNCDVTRWGRFTDIKDIKERCSSASRRISRSGLIRELNGLRWRHRGPCDRHEASGNAAGRTPGRARERSRPEQTSDRT